MHIGGKFIKVTQQQLLAAFVNLSQFQHRAWQDRTRGDVQCPTNDASQ
jgi:hypothetical protein